MSYIERYLIFCRKFHRIKIPKLKFKVLSDRYHDLYKKNYNVYENDINKASFLIFLASFLIFNLLLMYLTTIIIPIISLISVFLSIILSYKFNLILYNEISRRESEINAMLHIIKIDFSLIQEILKNNSDYSINFIMLIKDYNIPISSDFKIILKKIHEGMIPEDELTKLMTPSKNFDDYLKMLLTNNFGFNSSILNNNETDLEKKYKIYMKEIQSRISILFFVGIFFPLGLCFLILFQLINMIFQTLFVPIFLILLNFLFRKTIKRNSYLIGVLNNYSKLEKKKFDEFIQFLRSFAINLKRNISPELCFLNSYNQNINRLKLIKQSIRTQVSRLLNFNCTFNEILQFLKKDMKSVRYNVILDVIQKFIDKNSYYSSEKILNILTIISKHQNLEEKLELIIKGEKFKVFFFIFIVPILLGAISGMFPFFTLINENIKFNSNTLFSEMNNLMDVEQLIIIFFVFISSVCITSNYFLSVINHQNKLFLIIIIVLLFILAFFVSFINILSFI